MVYYVIIHISYVVNFNKIILGSKIIKFKNTFYRNKRTFYVHIIIYALY